MSTTVNIGELLSVCIDAAQKAGNEIRKVWKSGDLKIQDKGNDDPLTQADVKSQQLIVGILNKKWPTLNIVGEEDCEIPPTVHEPNFTKVDLSTVPESLKNVPIDDVCVFIDPLDATKEFTLGNLEAVITLVGIGYKGEAVAGVMYQPFVDDVHGNGTTYWALQGLPPVGVTPTSRGDGKLVLTTTRSHFDANVAKSLELIKADQVIKAGGAGFKVLLVLQGKADLYIFPTNGTKKWDTCAPEAILRACGGKMTDIRGNPFIYTKQAEVQNVNGVVCALDQAQVHKCIGILKDM